MELHLAPVSPGQDCRIPILRQPVSGARWPPSDAAEGPQPVNGLIAVLAVVGHDVLDQALIA
jgi:hypothetical protein